MLASIREEVSGSNVQSGGRPQTAAALVMWKSTLRARECSVLDVKDMIESKSHSIGNPKIVLTVTSGPSANDSVIGAPLVS